MYKHIHSNMYTFAKFSSATAGLAANQFSGASGQRLQYFPFLRYFSQHFFFFPDLDFFFPVFSFFFAIRYGNPLPDKSLVITA